MNQRIPADPAAAVPRIIPRAEHTISRSDISGNALRVLYRLKDAGFQAFLVGGGVRDVMLGRRPRISTSRPMRCLTRCARCFATVGSLADAFALRM